MENPEDVSFDEDDFDYSPNNRRLTRVISHEDTLHADHEKEFDPNSPISETDSMSSPNSPGMNETLCSAIKGLSDDQIQEMVSRLKVSNEESDSDKHTEDKDSNKEKTQGKGQKKKTTKTQPKKVEKGNMKSSKKLNDEQEISEVESLPTASTYSQYELPNSKKSKKGKKENNVADYEGVTPVAKYNIEPTNIDKELTDEDNKQNKTKRTQRGKQKPNEMNNEPKSEIQLNKNDYKQKIEDIEIDSQKNVAVIKPQQSRVMVIEKAPQEKVEAIMNPQQPQLTVVTNVEEKKTHAKKQNQKGGLKENIDVQEKSVKLLKKGTETVLEKKRNNRKVLTTEEINDNMESKSTRTTRAKANNVLKEVNEAVDKNIADNINSEEPKKARPQRNKDPKGHTKNMESEPNLEAGKEKPKKKLNSTKQKESEVQVESLSTLKAKEISKINPVKGKKAFDKKENKDTNEEIVKKRVTRKK